MKKLTMKEFIAEGTEKFGEDRKQWKFVCPKCKTEQSAQDFFESGVEKEIIDTQIGFSCIGRSVKEVGCDWTLGGLFSIHELEIIDEEGDTHPMFEFAETS